MPQVQDSSAREQGVFINPPAPRLGERHAFLWGLGRRHHVEGFRGPLSIKAVMRGRATWETVGRRYDLTPSSFIVVNEDQPYTISIRGDEPVETFCAFFRRGWIEEVGRVLSTDDRALLDHPDPGSSRRATDLSDVGSSFMSLHFPTFLTHDARVIGLLRDIHCRLSRGTPPGPWLEDRVVALGEMLILVGRDVGREIASIPVARAATQMELFRRLRRAVDFIEGSLDRPLRLEEMARAACLSPYHFHRLFTETRGETPHHFTRRLRLERARQRLERSSDTVTDICRDCGFESVPSFSALFRRRFGLPPARYRRKHRENGKNG